MFNEEESHFCCEGEHLFFNEEGIFVLSEEENARPSFAVPKIT